MNRKRLTLMTAGAVLLVIIAVGARALRDEPVDGQAATCPITVTNCEDTSSTENPSDGEVTTTTVADGQRLDAAALDALEQEARGLLGRNESDLSSDVRVGRKGTAAMMLTDDFVLGRMTVELDDTDRSGFRVVMVTVEIPSGTQTYELEPG